MLFKAAIPFFETLAAVGIESFIIGKILFEAFLGRCIVLTVIVRVSAANIWAGFVDAATTSRKQMAARIVNQQEPAFIVLVEAHIPVRKLPEQMIEVVHGAWRVNLLGDVGAAFGVFAEAAFGFGCKDDTFAHGVVSA